MCDVFVDYVVESQACERSKETYGICRLTNAKDELPVGALVLVESPGNSCGRMITVPENRCVFVPPGITGKQASLVPALVFSLWAWDKLALELGEVAVFTGSSLISRMLGQVALWRGACPVLSLCQIGPQNALIKYAKVGIDERDEISGWVRRHINGKSGFAAIDMDGRADLVDLILEIMPRWGRLMLVGEKTQSLTIDYYNNIHRKGAYIVSTRYEPIMIFKRDERPGIGEHLLRAFRILQNEKMCRDLQAAIGDSELQIITNNRMSA